MEKTQKSEQKTPQKLSEEAAEKKERLERLDPMTTSQIEHENTQMINDLYRLLKKYQGLRNLIRELKVSLIDAVEKGLSFMFCFSFYSPNTAVLRCIPFSHVTLCSKT